MPPKDDVNVIDGTLYFEDKNGELRPCISSEINVTDITSNTDCEDLVPGLFSMQPEYHIIGFDLDKLAYKMLVRIHQNNYRRLHGLRPVRHKVWRHNPFAAKRMGKLFRRGGFK